MKQPKRIFVISEHPEYMYELLERNAKRHAHKAKRIAFFKRLKQIFRR